MPKAPKKSNQDFTIKVDMSGVPSSTTVPEGDYAVKVESIEQLVSENSGKAYLKWTLKIIDGEFKGNNLYHNTSLQPQALFNLKNVLISLGVEVPDSVMNLKVKDILGLTCGVTVEHESYEGKKKARITDFFPLESSESDEEEDEDEDTSKEKDKSKGDDDEDEIDPDEMDLDEMLEYAKEHELDLGLSKLDKKDEKKVRKALRKVLADL